MNRIREMLESEPVTCMRIEPRRVLLVGPTTALMCSTMAIHTVCRDDRRAGTSMSGLRR